MMKLIWKESECLYCLHLRRHSKSTSFGKQIFWTSPSPLCHSLKSDKLFTTAWKIYILFIFLYIWQSKQVTSYQRRSKWLDIIVLTYVRTHLYTYRNTSTCKSSWQNVWIAILWLWYIAISNVLTASGIRFYCCLL